MDNEPLAPYAPGLPYSSVFIVGERIQTTLFTVVGPGFTDRYGRQSWRKVEVLCDPQYGGCGTNVVLPYYTVYQFPARYSCGCKRRRVWSEKDHTGESVTGYLSNRKLTILFFDESADAWLYVCECCGGTWHVPRGKGMSVFMHLKAESRKHCPNKPVFVALEDIKDVKRGTKFIGKEETEAILKAQLEAKYPGCKMSWREIAGWPRIVGIEVRNSVVEPTQS